MRVGGRVCVFLLCRSVRRLPNCPMRIPSAGRSSAATLRACAPGSTKGSIPSFPAGSSARPMTRAWYGRIDMMALFIERGANPRRTTAREQLLQLAARNGHRARRNKWLLDHGAVLNREGNQCMRAALCGVQRKVLN